MKVCKRLFFKQKYKMYIIFFFILVFNFGCKTVDLDYTVWGETKEPLYWATIQVEANQIFPFYRPKGGLGTFLSIGLFRQPEFTQRPNTDWITEAWRSFGSLIGLTEANAAIDIVYDFTIWPIEWCILHSEWEDKQQNKKENEFQEKENKQTKGFENESAKKS